MTHTKGAIYYTDNRPRRFILQACQEQISKAWKGKTISVSLSPINFGQNIVLESHTRSYPTMLTQIVMALETLDTDIVFFLEHDVLYHPSHFDFTPPKRDVYYYNLNNWRWGIMEDVAFTHDGQHSLSMLSCYRETALSHFQARLKYAKDQGWDPIRAREPRTAQIIGYEPGTKPVSRGGFSDETFDVWRSELPNIDIRHRHNFSSSKYHLSDFPQKPVNWQEKNIDELPYWKLRSMRDNWINTHGEAKLTRW